eukprot:6168130-Amphidinium_carterae.1
MSCNHIFARFHDTDCARSRPDMEPRTRRTVQTQSRGRRHVLCRRNGSVTGLIPTAQQRQFRWRADQARTCFHTCARLCIDFASFASHEAEAAQRSLQ